MSNISSAFTLISNDACHWIWILLLKRSSRILCKCVYMPSAFLVPYITVTQGTLRNHLNSVLVHHVTNFEKMASSLTKRWVQRIGVINLITAGGYHNTQVFTQGIGCDVFPTGNSLKSQLWGRRLLRGIKRLFASSGAR